MKRTTVFIDESVERDLHALARRARRPTSALIREALARYVGDEKKKAPGALRIIGMGRSGRHDTAERHEELLWSGLQPHGPARSSSTRYWKGDKKRRARGSRGAKKSAGGRG